MNKEQIAHDLAIFIMNHSHHLDDDVDYTILNTTELVSAYKQLYNDILKEIN